MRLRPFSITILFTLGLSAGLRAESSLRFCLRTEPRTFDPLRVADDSSETIRYLTGGVLVRVNRKTQELQPALATSWKISDGGRRIDFNLRQNVRFSDGTPFGPADVIYTFHQLMNPELHSPTADSFRAGDGSLDARVTGPASVSLRFPQPVAGLAALFDQVAILSSQSPWKEKAVLGPFLLAEHQPGVSLLLRRNPNYWEKDERGRKLPYLDAVHLDIQQNREGETLRFRRGEVDLVQNLEPELFDRLAGEKKPGVLTQDAGPSLDSELVWFNLNPTSPLPSFKKDWFNNVHFRRGLSMAIRRDDICKIVYRGHATPALGPVSPANHFWFNSKLPPQSASVQDAERELAAGGFHRSGGKLVDQSGHPVEFSLISNAGNRNHERMMAMIQQDLAGVGIRLNVVMLDFASIIERITRSFDYESCLMSLTNVDLDPNEQMNVWLSSASNHQWNPNQKQPATEWEARIDKLMKQQASSPDHQARKKLFDQVQLIAHEQQPFIYLVNPNVLGAASTRIQHLAPALIRPQIYWNVEKLEVKDARP